MIKAEEHFGLVAQLAMRYARMNKNERIEDTEEFSDGLVGLVQAINRFEPERGYQFSTYAFYCIRNAIWAGCNRRRPHEANFTPMSYWEDADIDPGYEDPEYIGDMIEQIKEFMVVKPTDSKKLARRKVVLREIFYQDRTLQDVGKEIGLSRERVRQLRDSGIEYLAERFVNTRTQRRENDCQLCGR